MNQERNSSELFSSLSTDYQDKEWTEEITETSKRITIPKEQIASLRAENNIQIYTPLTVRIISTTEIQQGYFDLPEDSINFARIDVSVLKDDHSTENSVIIQTVKFFQKISVFKTQIKKEQLCFSKTQYMVIILPKILD